MALGLISSEQIDDYWVQNARRRIFYAYPNGTAPLTAILSLMENKSTPLPQFTWDEERWTAIKTQTMDTGQPSSGVTFYLTGTTTTAGGPATVTAGQVLRLYVDDSSNFQIDDVICVFKVDMTSGSVNLVGRVTATDTTASLNYIEFKVNEAPVSTLLNTSSANEDKWVYQIASAYAEGARSRTGRQKFPTELTNYTQIHKTPFELTRTALKEPLKYDRSGAYKDVAKGNGIDHMAGIEWAAFFGTRKKETTTDPDTGVTVPRRFTGGLLWFMRQWELGSVSAGGAFDYGQADVSTQTDWVTYTNKRIIKLAGGTITGDQFDEIESRVFERTNSTDWSKLCLCGPGYLAKVASKYRRELVWTSMRDEGFKGFNYTFNKRMSNSGEIFYKVHPLFNDPIMRNSAFYIDVGYMGYRPLTDTDTDIQPMIQANDADKRKDQWITEFGFEIPYPEAFEYVEDLGGITL
jgi:hypothetical protein